MLSYIKKAAVLIAAAFIVFSAAPNVFAAGEGEYLFIDGENIDRVANTAVVYRGVETTGQSQWGASAVVDASGKITAFYDAGDFSGADLAVPEGGMVVSAAGSKVQWMRNNARAGRYASYDPYTRRLFVSGSANGFDPYCAVSFDVSGEENVYTVDAPDIEKSLYKYGVAVDKNGFVTARGANVAPDEDGFAVFARDEFSKEQMIANVPVGSACAVHDGKAKFSFTKQMLSRLLNASVAGAEKALEAAKASFADADYASAEAMIASAKELLGKKDPDYLSVANAAYELESLLPTALAGREIFELRAACHTPDETTEAEVAAAVAKAKDAGVNRIILRMTNGYGTFLPLPKEFRFSQDSKFGGFDVLGSFIEHAHKNGIGVAVCVDVFYNEFAYVATPDWLTSAASGAETETQKKFVSPASTAFKEFFIDYVSFLVSRYEIDGVILDRARYPRFSEEGDLGYDNVTLAGFAEKYGVPQNELDRIGKELFSGPHWLDWVEYRCELVTETVKAVSETVRSLRPDITLEAVAERDNVPYYYHQDVSTWLNEGLVDGVVLSLFAHDPDENDVIDAMAYEGGVITDKSAILSAYAGKSAYFFVGIDSTRPFSANAMANMIVEARRAGSDGIVFSDLDSLVRQRYSDHLAKNVFSETSVAPGGNAAVCERVMLDYAKEFISGTVAALGGCDETAEANATAAINRALADMGENGLTGAAASALEAETAMIFSYSPAKSAVTAIFADIAKFAALSKDEAEFIPPVDDESSAPEESSAGSEPEESEEISANVPENSAPDVSASPADEGAVGKWLAVAFVGVTLVAAAVALGVGISRRKKASNHLGRYKTEGENSGDIQ